MRSKKVICPYCNRPAKFWYDSSPVLMKNFGPIYNCDRCQAYVSCHRGHGGKIPLGTLAKFELRREAARSLNVFTAGEKKWQKKS